MAVALAIASAIVATEMIGLYGNRATHFRRKIDRLQARITQMEARLASANTQMAEMRREVAYHDEFERIFAAPDSQLVRLEPHERRADIACALVLSRRLAAAALDIVGLPSPPARGHYAAWWLPRQGAPTLAGQVEPPDRKATDAVSKIAFPSPDATALIITLQASPADDHPATPPMLKAELRRAVSRSHRSSGVR